MSQAGPSRPIAALQFLWSLLGAWRTSGRAGARKDRLLMTLIDIKGSRLRCAARFNDDVGTWYADLITIGRGGPNEAE